MNFGDINIAADRHPWRWALVVGVALGLLYMALLRSLSGGLVFGISIGAVQLLAAGVRHVARRNSMNDASAEGQERSR